MTGSLFKQLLTDVTVSYTPLLLSFAALLSMIVVSVSWHIYKAHTSNPTRYLKEE